MRLAPAGVRVLALLAIGACHRYTPVSVDPRTGDAVRLHLTTAGADRLAPTLGADVAAVDGRLLAAPRDMFEISVSGTVRRRDGRAIPGSGPPISIPRVDMAQIDVRRVDGPRTAGAVGLTILGAVAVKLVVNQVTGKAGGDDIGTIPAPPP